MYMSYSVKKTTGVPINVTSLEGSRRPKSITDTTNGVAGQRNRIICGVLRSCVARAYTSPRAVNIKETSSS